MRTEAPPGVQVDARVLDGMPERDPVLTDAHDGRQVSPLPSEHYCLRLLGSQSEIIAGEPFYR